MSDAEQGAREWRFYIQDMIEFSEKVLSERGAGGVRGRASESRRPAGSP